MALASLAEFYVYQARYLAARYNMDFAIVWTNHGKAGIGCSPPHGPNDYQTAAVNAMQGLAYVQGAVNISTSYRPTEKCLGMAKMRQFRRIYFAQGNALHSCNMQGDPPWNAAPDAGAGAPSRCEQMPAMLGNGFQLVRARVALATAELPTGPAVLADRERMVFIINWDRSLPFIVRRAPGQFVAPPALGRVLAPRNQDTGFMRNGLLMHLAFALVQAATNAGIGGGAVGRRIACVLVSPNDEILAWGINTATLHLTLHGEVNLITSYVSRLGALPAGCRFYTTLEPCHMCAGMLYETAAANQIRVYYGQQDPLIVNSVLNRNQRQFPVELDGGYAGALVNIGIDENIQRLTEVLGSVSAGQVFGAAILRYRAILELLRGEERALWWQGWRLLTRIWPNLRFDP